jgi:SAM-dependent MidA family methyltransferase
MPALAGYVSEINLRAEAWVRGMGSWLRRGVALLVDYGFPRREYYHPQRAGGTLMCHFRHHSHSDPFLVPGLQDITAHVDFTAMADAALEGGLDVLGYTSQARFLMNAGLMTLLAQLDPQDAAAHARAMAPVQKLLSEAEMGELFKVLAIGRGLDQPLAGFARGDRCGML